MWSLSKKIVWYCAHPSYCGVLVEHSINRPAVCRPCFLTMLPEHRQIILLLSAHRFFTLYTTLSFNICPTMLPHSTRVNLPCHVLCPGASFALTNSGSTGHLLPKELGFMVTKDFFGWYPLSLINFFNSVRTMAPGSSLADAASPVIFIFFGPNVFPNLCNQLLLAVNGLVSLVSGDPLPKS